MKTNERDLLGSLLSDGLHCVEKKSHSYSKRQKRINLFLNFKKEQLKLNWIQLLTYDSGIGTEYQCD